MLLEVGILAGVFLFGVILSAAIAAGRPEWELDDEDEEPDLDEVQQVLVASLENCLNWAREACRCRSCGSSQTTPTAHGFQIHEGETMVHLSTMCAECEYRHQMAGNIEQYAMIAALHGYDRALTCDSLFEMESFEWIGASIDEDDDELEQL